MSAGWPRKERGPPRGKGRGSCGPAGAGAGGSLSLVPPARATAPVGSQGSWLRHPASSSGARRAGASDRRHGWRRAVPARSVRPPRGSPRARWTSYPACRANYPPGRGFQTPVGELPVFPVPWRYIAAATAQTRVSRPSASACSRATHDDGTSTRRPLRPIRIDGIRPVRMSARTVEADSPSRRATSGTSRNALTFSPTATVTSRVCSDALGGGGCTWVGMGWCWKASTVEAYVQSPATRASSRPLSLASERSGG